MTTCYNVVSQYIQAKLIVSACIMSVRPFSNCHIFRDTRRSTYIVQSNVAHCKHLPHPCYAVFPHALANGQRLSYKYHDDIDTIMKHSL